MQCYMHYTKNICECMLHANIYFDMYMTYTTELVMMIMGYTSKFGKVK